MVQEISWVELRVYIGGIGFVEWREQEMGIEAYIPRKNSLCAIARVTFYPTWKSTVKGKARLHHAR
jgi:hypothetical protein